MEDRLAYSGSGSSLEGQVGGLSGEGLEEEEHVMSEVHLGCPPAHSGPHVSCFSFSIPPGNSIYDSFCELLQIRICKHKNRHGLGVKSLLSNLFLQ